MAYNSPYQDNGKLPQGSYQSPKQVQKTQGVTPQTAVQSSAPASGSYQPPDEIQKRITELGAARINKHRAAIDKFLAEQKHNPDTWFTQFAEHFDSVEEAVIQYLALENGGAT